MTLQSKTRILRRIAQMWSLLSIAFVLLFVIGELFNPSGPAPTPAEWVGLAFFPIGVVVGLVLAWRWEGIGGGTAVLSLLAFYTWEFICRGDFPGGPFFLLVAAPGFLFLIYWARSRRDHKNRRAVV